VQQLLAGAGYSPGPADGIFGSKTELAVKAFQKNRGLRTDGLVGPNTRSALGY
jgi:peptidoglycan hydrolase-like protein with peptidoglycan-binding domain